MDVFVKEIHARKTTAFLDIVETLPLRPGIRRFMDEIDKAGIPMGICTTSNEKVAHVIAGKILKGISFSVIIAGDMVSKKKPDPEIYITALEKLKVKPSECLVVEDSNIGVRAAKAAGCNVLATYSGYTQDEDLSPADIIASCLGDEEGEKAEFVKIPVQMQKEGVISLPDIMKLFS